MVFLVPHRYKTSARALGGAGPSLLERVGHTLATAASNVGSFLGRAASAAKGRVRSFLGSLRDPLEGTYGRRVITELSRPRQPDYGRMIGDDFGPEPGRAPLAAGPPATSAQTVRQFLADPLSAIRGYKKSHAQWEHKIVPARVYPPGFAEGRKVAARLNPGMPIVTKPGTFRGQPVTTYGPYIDPYASANPFAAHYDPVPGRPAFAPASRLGAESPRPTRSLEDVYPERYFSVPLS